MAENDNQFNKEVCDLKHSNIKDKLGGLKANIDTSKESLSIKLDEVNSALLGNVAAPGGLLRDTIETNKEIKRHKEDVQKEITRLRHIVYICFIGVALLLGGKISGLSLNNIIQYFRPTPVVIPAPEVEKNKDVPVDVQEYIKKQLDTYEKNVDKKINNSKFYYMEDVD